MATIANSPDLRLAFSLGAKTAATNFTYQRIGLYRARALQGLLRRDPLAARIEMAQLKTWTAA
jgi:hypothetical protein